MMVGGNKRSSSFKAKDRKMDARGSVTSLPNLNTATFG